MIERMSILNGPGAPAGAPLGAAAGGAPPAWASAAPAPVNASPFWFGASAAGAAAPPPLELPDSEAPQPVRASVTPSPATTPRRHHLCCAFILDPSLGHERSGGT